MLPGQGGGLAAGRAVHLAMVTLVTLETPPSFWSVVKASAVRRLGVPLLKAYVTLLVLGILVVLVSIVLMRFS